MANHSQNQQGSYPPHQTGGGFGQPSDVTRSEYQQGMASGGGHPHGFGVPGNGGPQHGGQQHSSGQHEVFRSPPTQDRGRPANADQRGNVSSPTSGQRHNHRTPSPRQRSPYHEGGRRNDNTYYSQQRGFQSPQSDSSYDNPQGHSYRGGGSGRRDNRRNMYDSTQPRHQMNWNNNSSPRSYHSDSSQSRGGGRYRDTNSDVTLSKKLSFLLRHGAERQGFTLMSGGFLYVDDILRLPALQDFGYKDVERIVQNNDKQRFALKENPDNRRMMIRANQGHTIEVDDLDLQPITSADEAELVVHGTYYQSWEIIKFSGLSRMGRNHIHFAAGEPGENGVISGMRSSCEVIIRLDIKKALADGLKFFRSANNVILCAGDKDGIIYPAYFEGAIQRYPRMMLQFDRSITKASATESPPKSKKNKNKNKKREREREDDNEGGKKKPGRQEKKERKENQSDDVDLNLQGVFIEGKDSKEDTIEAACVEQEKQPDTPPVDEEPNQPADVVPQPGQPEASPDVEVEEVYDVTKIDDNQISACTLNSIRDTRPVVAVCCYGEKLGEEDGSISHIMCADRKDCFLFLVGENPSLMTEGKLHDFLTSKDFPKVFHGCGKASKTLFKQFEVVLDGTNIYDTKVVYELMNQAGEGDMKDFKEVGFCPDTWPEDLQSTLLQDRETEERDRCVAILRAYEIMIKIDGMDKKYKKDIFEEANQEIGIEVIREFKKVKAKQAKQAQSVPPAQKSKGKKKGKK